MPPAFGAAPTTRPSKNIARGAKYTLTPEPNYPHCTDAGDIRQLTDGVYHQNQESFWTQQSTVGWLRKRLAIITIDLGSVKPIRGVSFHTAAGRADVLWPTAIRILTAGEDRKFYDAGNLMEMSAQQGRTEPTGYANYRYWTDQMQMHGRYVCVAVWGHKMTFVDEIEVYEGEPGWVNKPLQGASISVAEGGDFAAELSRHLAIGTGIRKRLEQDIGALKEAAKAVAIPVETRRQVLDELGAVEENLGEASLTFGENFRTVLPLNSWHTRVMRTQAWLWRARGLEPLTFWQSNLWDPVPYIATPDTIAGPVIDVHMMRREYRAGAFNISNSDDEPAKVTFKISGLPGGDNPDYITVHEVIWTDTLNGVPSAAALPEITADFGSYIVNVPAGMTRQVWLTFNPVDVEPGTYDGEIVAGGEHFPLRMHLYPLDFPEKQTLRLGGWDYTHEAGKGRTVTEENQSLIVKHMRERMVDSPWGSPRLMNPSYEAVRGAYNARGEMTEDPDTSKFDAWLELWPDAAQYLVFLRVGNRFTYAEDSGIAWPIDTPEFKTAVKDWATFWAAHAEKKGVKPEQLSLLLVDEPSEDHNRDHIILAWAQAIRAADTGMRIWEDVNHRDMNKALEAMIDSCHVLCPHMQIFLNTSTPRRTGAADQAYRDYYIKKRDQGIELQFYGADGPARLVDPYVYYRMAAWTCWRYGATGMYFWSLTDRSGTSSWNEYLAAGRAYAPFFIAPDAVTAGKHLEAQREGVEDFEYLVMLDRAIREAEEQGKNGRELDKARQLLKRLPPTVSDVATVMGNRWSETKDRTLADKARIQILEALTALAEE